MVFLYDIAASIYFMLIRIAALWSDKARKFIAGRRSLPEKIRNEVNAGERCCWFHFASLGEFEQGRPVIEALKHKDPSIKVVMTFFSPSGYEIRKDYTVADHVFYLPADTRRNAEEFVRLINPRFAVFTKYEYWFHYFSELNQRGIPLYMISAIFRKRQPFFRFYGTLHRQMLRMVSHFFVQDQASVELLHTLGIGNVTLSGDTRFDRVAGHAKNVKSIPLVESFCRDAKVFIAGSTWPADEKILAALAVKAPDWKFIIAPHEITEGRISAVSDTFTGAVRYSALDRGSEIADPTVLIIDNIGMLSSLYQYGRIAYIGGGFGKAIHNTQEALAFGLPVIFGPNYQRFKEAVDMVELGGAKSVRNEEELLDAFRQFGSDPQAGAIAKNYVSENTGATQIILDKIVSA